MISLWCILFSACGYRFVGVGVLPSGIEDIYIAVLENRTSEIGIETIFTNDLVHEFTGRRIVLTEKEEADAILSGVIVSMNIETVTHLERRVKIVLDLKLTDQSGRIVWYAKDISISKVYRIGKDRPETEQNRRVAILVLSERFAEMIFNRLVADF